MSRVELLRRHLLLTLCHQKISQLNNFSASVVEPKIKPQKMHFFVNLASSILPLSSKFSSIHKKVSVSTVLSFRSSKFNNKL